VRFGLLGLEMVKKVVLSLRDQTKYLSKSACKWNFLAVIDQQQR
jgi:hypothetical protein